MQHNNLLWQSFHLHSQHDVKWGRPMLPMPRTRTHHMTLPPSPVMNVMNSDTLSWTALTENPLQGHCCHTTRPIEITTPDLALGTTCKTEKEETSPDHSLDTEHITAPAAMICTEAPHNHNSGTGTATIEAAQGDPIEHTEDTATGPTKTHHTGHTANLPHTAGHQATTLRIAVDHTHDHPTNHWSIVHTEKDHTVQDHTPTKET